MPVLAYVPPKSGGRLLCTGGCRLVFLLGSDNIVQQHMIAWNDMMEYNGVYIVHAHKHPY